MKTYRGICDECGYEDVFFIQYFDKKLFPNGVCCPHCLKGKIKQILDRDMIE